MRILSLYRTLILRRVGSSSVEEAAKGDARWSEKEAFGELNYLKAAQEQAPFMSVPHNGGFVGCALGTRVACTRSRTTVAGGGLRCATAAAATT